MTPKTVAIAVALALALVSTQALAGWYDAGELKDRCSDDASATSWGVCHGFIIAIAGIMEDGTYNGSRACPPDGAKASQIKAVVKKYLDDHPEKLHHPAEWLTAEALAEAFPCPK